VYKAQILCRYLAEIILSKSKRESNPELLDEYKESTRSVYVCCLLIKEYCQYMHSLPGRGGHFRAQGLYYKASTGLL
jgi:hypothetical protein